MNIAFISSEVFPFSKTGGLGDVSGILPIEISKFKHDVRVITPKYSIIDDQKFNIKLEEKLGDLNVRVAGNEFRGKIYSSILPGSTVKIYFIQSDVFFNRPSIYTDDFDEDTRFIFFQKAAIELIQLLKFKPDIVHCNDWQTGLIPLMIKDNYSWDKLFLDTKTVFTIHNIGYQGRFASESVGKAELQSQYFFPGGPLEFEGGINFLRAGLEFSDMISTVSQKYADEILSIEYGAGLQEVLWKRRKNLIGILNGISSSEWNPWFDKRIAKRYSVNNFAGKSENKKAVLKSMNLSYDDNVPVIGIISRMAYQKGFDIIVSTLPHLIDMDIKFVILGSGEPEYEEFFKQFASDYPDKVAVHIGYNEDLAHLIEAGSDMFLMPSKYEPCGLNQMYSLKYGTVPIVRKTGGLADTVFDWDEYSSQGLASGNGFSFVDYSGYALSDAIKRAVKYYHKPEIWQKIIKNGMRMDFSWKSSAKKYIVMYRKLKKN